MQYLHTMIRINNLEKSLEFYCEHLGLKEVRRFESESGKFTLIFLCAPDDFERAKEDKAPLIELTYNWPDENGNLEELNESSRNFGHLAFRVDNIYETCEKLMNSGVEINRPPRDGHMAFIKSPNNISIELLQKGESLKPSEPWISMKNIGKW